MSVPASISLAEPEGYLRVFVDEGPPLERLLRKLSGAALATDYVFGLVEAFASPKREPDAAGVAPGQVVRAGPDRPLPLVDPLSKRELQVLRLLPTYLSSSEIADQLCIAPSTVRSHIKHIYGKLQVHGRAEAVQRAEELALL